MIPWRLLTYWKTVEEFVCLFKGKMVTSVLLLLLVNTGLVCYGFGFKSCSQNFPDNESMWCSRENIANVSDVVSMFPVNLTYVNLSKNKIKVIRDASFSKFRRLKNLDLGENQLAFLKRGAFVGLTALKILNLTCNNISRLYPRAFEGLTSLQTLLLGHNQVQTISSDTFQYLPVLKNIDLSLNKLTVFSCENFYQGSSTLKELNLFANSLRRVNVSCFPALWYAQLSNNSELTLPPDAFASNLVLRVLKLQAVNMEVFTGLSVDTKRRLSGVSFSLGGEKSLKLICEQLQHLSQLMTLEVDFKGSRLPQTNSSLLDCPTPNVVVLKDAKFGNVAQVGAGNTTKFYLTNCGIKKISRSTFSSYSKLKILELNQNKVNIESDAFKSLTHLTLLSIEKNKMRDINPLWFSSLKRLTVLSLTKNEITELTTGVFSSLTRLEDLYLQFNLLKYITKKPFSKLRRLKKLNLSLNIIDFIEDGSFEDLSQLYYLDLSGNRLKKLTPAILNGLTNLRKIILFNNHISFKPNESPSFINLTSLEYIEMRYQAPGGIGIGSIGPNIFQGLSNLIQLAMGDSILTDFHPNAFGPLVKLKKLFISSMIMRDINLTALFSPLKQLEKLTLYRTDLDNLPTRLLPLENSLIRLRVDSNHLRTVDKRMLDSLPRLRVLNLRENPLSCTCENSWFKSWAVFNTYTQVPFLYNLQCDNSRGSPYLWELKDLACTSELLSFTLFVSCSVTDMLLVCLCLAWHTQGPTLRYLWLLLKAKYRGHKGAPGARFQYDAFVSYSSKDEAWVMEKLVPRLEKPTSGAKLRLCLHHRDFHPGAFVMDNVEAAIYNSRHTICVITRNFLQSEWCSVEFQLASLRLLFDGSDVLLLLFLEEIPDRCLSPFTRLRKIVRKKTYLMWPEDVQEQEAFWVRLVQVIKEKEDEETEAEDGLALLIN